MKRDTQKTIDISSIKNLTLKIFVIGYKNVGESILYLLFDNNEGDSKVVFSMLIDSYEQDDKNLSGKILDKFGVKYLDIVCWTHPHVDHSIGIDKLIEKYFNKDNTVIFMPKLYFGNLTNDVLKKESNKTPAIYVNIKNIPHIDNNIRTISANGDASQTFQMDLNFIDDDIRKEMDIYFLTPISNLIDRYALKGHELSRPNDLSVSYIVSLDGYDFYFGGDTETPHIEKIKDKWIKDMRWIKVPHHCSLGGQYLADNLGPKFNYGASTVYYADNLPVKEIQDRYVNPSQRLFMTQMDKDQTDALYGIVEFDYKFNNSDIKVDITTYGNAGEYLKE